MSNTLFAQA